MTTKELSIVLNPDTAEIFSLDSAGSGSYHSTALKKFPKRLNGGKELIHFGRIFNQRMA